MQTLTDVAKQQLSSQETGVAVVVSTDLHGWQRFDVEEDEVDGVFGMQMRRYGLPLCVCPRMIIYNKFMCGWLIYLFMSS